MHVHTESSQFITYTLTLNTSSFEIKNMYRFDIGVLK